MIRPILTVTLGYLLGVTALLLVPSLVEILFFRSTFSEFGSRWRTVQFVLMIWGVLAGPSAATLTILLVGLKRRLGAWSPRARLLSGMAPGLAVGLVAAVGIWEDLGSAIFPGGGLHGMIAASALTGVAAAVCLAAVSSVGSALARSRAASS